MRLPCLQLHNRRKVTGDAPCIAELRAAGALLIGKANLHEVGVGMTGLNTRHGTTRNPYDVNAYAGGSSSGSAAAVSSGLCAFALGAALHSLTHPIQSQRRVSSGTRTLAAVHNCLAGKPPRCSGATRVASAVSLSPGHFVGSGREIRLCWKLVFLGFAGIDGGGSVRVPSSLCGIVGLRPTVGRTSTRHCPDNAFSIMSFGVHAACMGDASLVYAAIANAGQLPGRFLRNPLP